MVDNRTCRNVQDRFSLFVPTKGYYKIALKDYRGVPEPWDLLGGFAGGEKAKHRDTHRWATLAHECSERALKDCKHWAKRFPKARNMWREVSLKSIETA